MLKPRVVTKQFSAADVGTIPKKTTSFQPGEKVMMTNDDGSHVEFVRQGDTKLTEPFAVLSETFEDSTEDDPSPR